MQNYYLILSGILSSFFVFNRFSDTILLLPILYYYITLNRKETFIYYLSLAITSIPFALYNLYFFDSIFGGYSQVTSLFMISPVRIFFNFITLLFSPSSGIFIFSPILILSIVGFFLVHSLSNKNIQKLFYLFGFTILLQIFVYACWPTSWGGPYGNRYLIVLFPIMIIYICIFLNNFMYIRRTTDIQKFIAVSILIVLIVISLSVQIIGSFYHHENFLGKVNKYYNGTYVYPDDEYLVPVEYWDWGNNIIVTSFHDGLAINPGYFFNKLLPTG
jgi:hypothetical protein